MLSSAKENGYSWTVSSHRGKKVWRIRYGREQVGTCRVGDAVKLGELVSRHMEKASAGIEVHEDDISEPLQELRSSM